jgi:hypothetical protein
MAGCKVTSGITNSCLDLLKSSGMGKTFWVGYLSDLDTRFSLALSADISTIDFGSYGTLFRFDGSKFAHDWTSTLAVGGGGSKSWTQNFNAKLISGSTADDLQLQKLSVGDDIFIIAEDLNQQFWILGAGNGLSTNESTSGSGGKETGGDISDVVNLTGNEITPKPLRFALGGGYQATLDYIESREG